jgi:hypothetical protein
MRSLLGLVMLIHSWYPHECCGDQHCQPVPCATIKRQNNIWIYLPKQLKFSQARPSPDGGCHVCYDDNHAAVTYALCLFLPQVNS